MCGRFVRQSGNDTFAELFDAVNHSDLTPNYNVAPTQTILAARLDERGERELVGLRWGLVPSWSKGPDNRYSMINARAESVTEKPAYRNAYRKRRCLIAADGFYEWQQRDRGKQPFFIHLIDRPPFAMAGLWEFWQGEDESIESCAIITTVANRLVSDIHDRMPVILAPEHYQAWLSEGGTDLLKPFPAEALDAYPVSAQVNRPANNTPACLQPL